AALIRPRLLRTVDGAEVRVALVARVVAVGLRMREADRMSELVRDDAGRRLARRVVGPEILVVVLAADDHPAFDDLVRAFAREKFRRGDAEHAGAHADEIAKNGAVAVEDHLDATPVGGADDLARVGAGDVEGQRAGDLGTEARRRYRRPLLE